MDLFEAARIPAPRLRAYQLATRLLPPVLMERREPAPARRGSATNGRPPSDAANGEEEVGRPVLETSSVVDLVAENVAAGAPWWRGFAGLVTDAERWKQLLAHERTLRGSVKAKEPRGVARMVAESGTLGPSGAEMIVQACHTAWRRRMGRLSAQAENQQQFYGLVEREFERLRIDFARCKSAATLRATLTDFWARAGGAIPELQTGWRAILPYLSEERWQEARDLALLALVSYAGPGDRADADQDATTDASLSVP